MCNLIYLQSTAILSGKSTTTKQRKNTVILVQMRTNFIIIINDIDHHLDHEL